ncbi:dioxygenase [Microbacterium hominis]|uniref:Dioxygenase n=1 Tax=Microbacterium hominis TaxID=162426 RepID=A0A7D4TFL6_9MICO|nr:dioxygenase [Microbacterium hominis]QKJ19480.1 dioxygenase [Microbacterium hominis]
MASRGKDREAREARERTRVYQARQAFHDGQGARRRRDNLVAGIVGGLLIAGLIASQAIYFTSGPGAPAPSPVSTPAPSTSPAPTEEPVETPEPSPSGSTTPSPSPTDSPSE